MIRRALADATARLASVSDTPRLDAEILMAHALGIGRDTLLLGGLDGAVPDAFAALVARRMTAEPIAYILGTKAFWTLDLSVGPGALIPRPDSETLIEAAVAHFAGTAGPAQILDLGTGPGTLLLAASSEWPAATGIGVDASHAALAYATHSASIVSMLDRVHFVVGDWAGAIDGRFDLILANPPYIGTGEPLPPSVAAHEPHEALFAGPDGLDAYRAIVPDLPRLLAPGGVAAIEIGWTQAESVSAMVAAQGLAVTLRRDLGGRPRAIIAT